MNENVSRVMSRNKARNTKPELNLRRSLYADGVRGYRLNWKKAPGTPDIAFPGKKMAFFINGCYWNRCPHCELPLPKTNKEFWEEKFDKNIKRDIKKEKELLDLGWIVLVFWECKIKTNMKDCTNKIKAILECH